MSVPYEPELEMVNVPPVMSSGPSFLVRARVGEVVDVAGDGPEALVVGIVDDRGEEPLEVEVDRDRQVHVVVQDERAVADRGVHVRELVQRVDHRPGDERQVGEAEALLVLELPSRTARRTRSTSS